MSTSYAVDRETTEGTIYNVMGGDWDSALSEGGLVADVIAAIASIDPVMGGVDR